MHSPTPTLTVTPPPECDPLCNVRLMVDDCAGIDDHCVATIRIEDAQAPQIACPRDASVECAGKCGTPPDDPRLAPFFGGVSATDECAADPVVSHDAPPVLRLGSTAVTFTAADHCANRASCVSNAEVVDTTPPAITVTLDRTTLWPPNHKLVRVAAEVAVSDLCDPDPTFVLTSISSDEPDNGLGDGDQVNDIQGADLGTPDKEFFLRAERSGQGDGRTYTIAYTALDGCGTGPGNAATATVHVHVSHDR